ncbi:SpoVR family protein [Chitiniphilus shinanonensis]|uniref:SpoVR family protein n=1 Tax=Chitiniphilus shinanonensis TaxID=553088 RepID=A0ABQ6BVG2_9NEIS|nr:SpoVR family protein [Chitiniphilus shinanonensis]GLS03903.1 SpoVR family protein [Chitiniphilus shinanonensis]
MTRLAHTDQAQQPLSTGSEWTFELIQRYYDEIARIAADFGLDTYPNQLEIISAEQMMDAYASVGMPVMYHHWSYGKHFLATQKHYQRGAMGLAYEIVINSNPCIAYLMEENTMTMQALVIAHAAFGHNSFFKGNYLFRTWTEADAIIDYLVFAKHYIAECEARHGEDKVEELLDSCHALMNYGVDRYKRPQKLSLAQERARLAEREEYQQSQVNTLWRTIPRLMEEREQAQQTPRFPDEPQENLLYFIEKFAPLLEPWQRELVRIVRKIAQYFYPQRQTQVMNEGWATFWHYTLMNRLYDEGLLTDAAMFEFLHSHTNVIAQPGVDSPYFNGINPYALGFAMYRDIQRICTEPTDEDRQWFPQLAGSDWRQALDFAMRNFKDESFIAQYLSPKLIRDFHLFAILDDDQNARLKVSAIHDDAGYADIRRKLAEQYNLAAREPNIQVYEVNTRTDRALTLRHYQYQRRPLANSVHEVLKHVARLWGFTVKLESVDEEGRVILTYDCKVEKRHGQ